MKCLPVQDWTTFQVPQGLRELRLEIVFVPDLEIYDWFSPRDSLPIWNATRWDEWVFLAAPKVKSRWQKAILGSSRSISQTQRGQSWRLPPWLTRHIPSISHERSYPVVVVAIVDKRLENVPNPETCCVVVSGGDRICSWCQTLGRFQQLSGRNNKRLFDYREKNTSKVPHKRVKLISRRPKAKGEKVPLMGGVDNSGQGGSPCSMFQPHMYDSLRSSSISETHTHPYTHSWDRSPKCLRILDTSDLSCFPSGHKVRKELSDIQRLALLLASANSNVSKSHPPDWSRVSLYSYPKSPGQAKEREKKRKTKRPRHRVP